MFNDESQPPGGHCALLYPQKFRQPLPVEPHHYLSVYDRGWGGENPHMHQFVERGFVRRDVLLLVGYPIL